MRGCFERRGDSARGVCLSRGWVFSLVALLQVECVFRRERARIFLK